MAQRKLIVQISWHQNCYTVILYVLSSLCPIVLQGLFSAFSIFLNTALHQHTRACAHTCTTCIEFIGNKLIEKIEAIRWELVQLLTTKLTKQLWFTPPKTDLVSRSDCKRSPWQ